MINKENNMREYVKDSVHMTSHRDNSSQYPTITVDENGNSYSAWQSFNEHEEVIDYRENNKGKLGETVTISGRGLALRPTIHYFDGVITVAWSEYRDELWLIILRQKVKGRWTDEVIVSRGEALFYPFLGDNKNDFILTYCKQTTYHSDVYLYNLSTRKNEKVNVAAKCYRPTFVYDKDGSFFVVYDSFNGITYDIIIRARINDLWTQEKCISQSKYRCAQPCIGLSGDLKVVGWYENGSSSYFSYNTIDVGYINNSFHLSNYQILVENRNWYNNINITYNQKGLVVFTYTIGKTNILCRIRGLDGIWTKGVLLSFNDTNCAIRPQAALDNNGKLSYVWQYAMKNGHKQRNAEIIYNEVSLKEIAVYNDYDLEVWVDKFVQPIACKKNIELVTEDNKVAWLKEKNIDCNLYFGDIHGQSNMSDGQGELDQYYHYAKIDAHMDFCALTDHDIYPDVATDSEWEWNRATRNLFNSEENFTALLSFEWTSNEYKNDFGHKNVYYPGKEGSLFPSVDPKGLNPDRLYKSIKKAGGQCIPHHPAANWGLVSAATDWDYHDEEVERLVEIFSRHANYEKTEDMSKYTKNVAKFPDHCAQDALSRKYHLGFTAGSDSHQMEHGIEGGIVCVYSKENTSESIWKALYDRHTYATTGSRILLSFDANGAQMGEEISIDEEVKITVHVVGTQKIKKVEIIKDNKTIFKAEDKEKEVNFAYLCENGKGEHCYYVRVEQEDEQLAWSSPIWITSK
jgi:hypothetical protein